MRKRLGGKRANRSGSLRVSITQGISRIYYFQASEHTIWIHIESISNLQEQVHQKRLTVLTETYLFCLKWFFKEFGGALAAQNYVHEQLVDGNITGVDSTYIGRFYLRFHYKETE